MVLRVGILGMLLWCGTGFAQSYTDLAKALAETSEKSGIHRLKAQVAQAAVRRLETEKLSATERKKLKAEALALCSDVQLGAMDLWFGDSVVTWGRLLLLEGNWKEARSLLWGQAEVLQNIEKNLAANGIPVSSISPVAGCRHALGETYRMEYEATNQLEPAIEALKHFYNVQIKYGDSPWGMQAQQKAEAAKAFVEGRGKEVRIDLGQHRATFVRNKFRLGARLTAEGNHGAAVDQVLDAINFFPESGQTIEALRNLGVCFLNLGRDDEAMASAEYLCERFGSDTNAPVAVLGIGRQYIESGHEEMGEGVFDLYLASFPSDARRTDILSYFAWKAYKTGDWPEAINRFHQLEAALRTKGETGAELQKAVYIQASRSADPARLEQFIAEFPDSNLVPTALGEKAQALLVAGAFDAAFQTLETLGERFPEAAASRTALAGLIVAAVEAERFDIAGQVLDRMLADRKAYGHEVYLSTGEGLLSAQRHTLAERAFAAVPLNAKRAFVERALYGTAAAQFGRGQFGQSFQTLETLLAKYPNSGRYFDARLMQARSLVRLGRINEAAEPYGEVVALKQDYAVAYEWAQVLQEPEEKLAALQRIALLADPDTLANRPLIADSIVASLPIALELRKYQLAVESCDQFEELFPKHDQLNVVAGYRKEAADALAQ
ncbi:hypothetical protein PDESU_05612 [Pontiella desulfatans]|uniref:Outer membrane protein assembly factor BamD n=1 Tax=Pontiella desulfatans TaxID=2750659 RepID=A0A6C2UA95_PONDE|nr:tetratricopeptide repeat protein [Pontiella desulfatans]VGO17018.1 hypothetical protein PDESU_05612 [Pontiella desulfatans]